MSDNPLTEQELEFEKLRREITVAAREQGNDPEENRRLRVALARADAINMPESMQQGARKLGVGEADGPDYQEKLYEGYGDAGVAVIVRTITDDPSRTHAELEHLFDEFGGNLGDEGCVAWQFERRGVLEVPDSEVADADQFLLEVIEWGAQELEEPIKGGLSEDTHHYRIFCDPNDLNDLDRAVAKNYEVSSTSIYYEPTQELPVEHDVAFQFLRFFERLLELPDVQRAHANWTFA